MKRPVVWVVAVLLLVAAATMVYRVLVLGYPLPPYTSERGWQVSLDGFVRPSAERVAVRIGYPARRPGRLVIEQEFTSSRFYVRPVYDGTNRFVEWTGVPGDAGGSIGYRAMVVHQPPVHRQNPAPGPWPSWAGTNEQRWAQTIAQSWAPLAPPKRLRALLAWTAGRGQPRLTEPEAAPWSVLVARHGREDALLLLLRAAAFPARSVRGLQLGSRVTTRLEAWIEVWTGARWECVLLSDEDEIRGEASCLPLLLGNEPAVRITGGELGGLRWTISRQAVSPWQNHVELIRGSDHWLDAWSLFHLPAEYQDTFRILVLVPLGALLIGFLRNVIGFPTFGIFMPVLIALAFRNTGLFYGLGLFAGIIVLGFLARRGVNRLRLLLVPRLSLILTLVILVIIALALAGNKVGRKELMAVGLLPFVILTMTIERLFVVVEETGAREGLRMALGSVAVAVITYAILDYEPLQLLFFIYPELLLAVAAAQVLLGRYTGYRLSEYYRFRKLRSPGES